MQQGGYVASLTSLGLEPATISTSSYSSSRPAASVFLPTLAKGLLTDKYRPDNVFDTGDERSPMPRFRGAEFQRLLERSAVLQPLHNLKSEYAVIEVNCPREIRDLQMDMADPRPRVDWLRGHTHYATLPT